MEALIPAKLVIDDGVVRSEDYQDIYFSVEDGLAETRHVFHKGTDLGQAWGNSDHFTIAETGFGTGLNFLATWQLFRQCPNRPGRLHYISIEKHPLRLEDLERCNQLFSQLEPLGKELIAGYPPMVSGFHRIWLDRNRVCLTLCFMDVTEALDQIRGKVGCWFLDGFAPSRNAQMWSESVFRGIARLSEPGTRFSTFTVAGHVRRGLIEQGFRVAKTPGFGRKREMLCGALQQPADYRDHTPWFRTPPGITQGCKAIVIGAGIAGAQAAWHLAIRGWQVTVIERHSETGTEASGNPAAVISPRVTARPSIAEQFSVQAYLYQLDQFRKLGPENCGWHPCGAVQLAYSKDKLKQWQGLERRHLPETLLHCISPEEASRVAGIGIDHPALLFENAGWVQPKLLVDRLLDHCAISVIRSRDVASLQYRDHLWQALDSDGECFSSAGVVIVASGSNLGFSQTRALPHTPVQGQTSFANASQASRRLATVIQHDGYITPSFNDKHLLGATYNRRVTGNFTDPVSDQQNLRQLAVHGATITDNLGAINSAHAATRMTSANRMPYIGPVPDQEILAYYFPAMRRKDFTHSPATSGYRPGMYISGAYGSRGFTNAALGGELVASLVCGEALPIQARLFHAVHPSRSMVKALQKS